MAHYRSGNWEMADPCMRYWAVAWLRSSLKSPLMERNQSTQNNSNNNKRTVNYNYGCEPVDYNLDYRETGSGKTFTIDSILGLPDTEGEAEGEEEEASLTSRLQGTEFPPKSTHPSTDAKSSHEEPLRCKESSQSGNLQRSNHHRRHKRVRTIFSPEQLERLEAEFERQQYMVGPERLYLATSLRLSEAQVKVWFQNRRIKWRKQHLEQQRRLHLATSYNP